MDRPRTLQTLRATDTVVIERAVRDDGRCVVVVAAARDVPGDVGRGLIADIARHHGAIDDEHVPAVDAVDVDADVPWVSFDCPAVCDASVLMSRLAERTALIPYGAADAFIVSLREAMRAAHRAQPSSHLGRFSPHNVWFAADGRWWLVGFGRNFPLEVRGGAFDVTVPFFMAPELIGGARSTAITDFVALILFMRSVLAYVDLPERLGALLRGEIGIADATLALQLMRFEQRVVSALPGKRASIEEAMEISDAVRAELKVVLDPEGFRRHTERLLVGVGQPAPTAGAADGSWLQTADQRIKLGRAQRRILLALREASQARTGLSVDAAAAAGWPGETLLFDSARNRVYAVVRQLRQAGVQIERFDGGYRLADDVPALV